MCLFSIKFEGRTYNKGATLLLLRHYKEKIAILQDDVVRGAGMYSEELARRKAAESDLDSTREIARNLKAEVEKLKEELNDFPARNKSGKYTKRVKTETKNQNKE